MILRTIVLAALLAQAPSAPATSCAVIERTDGVRIWSCVTKDGEWVPVRKDWFKAHCTRNPQDKSVASCDASAPNEALAPKQMAGPSKFKDHLKVIGYSAVGGAIIAACIAGGGCGFAAGG